MEKLNCQNINLIGNIIDVHNILRKTNKYPEGTWLSLIHLHSEQIKKIDIHERKKIFSDALDSGNYNSLLNSLNKELCFTPAKEDLFLYESGTLHFYKSAQAKAFDYYNKYIKTAQTKFAQNQSMLRIIEATHGDVDKDTKNNIDRYLQILKKSGKEYNAYAKYWELHIKVERGIFEYKEYKNLINELLEIRESAKDTEIYNELLKRCYTDTIRIFYLLMMNLPDHFIEEFGDAIKTLYPNNKTLQEYHNILYIKAYSRHYNDLPWSIIKAENSNQIYNEALLFYCKAINSGQENIKSNSTCELKKIDLQMFYVNDSSFYEKSEITIKKFISNAEVNKVSVHVAYAKTILGKLYIVRNLNDEEYWNGTKSKYEKVAKIVCLTDARKIYQEYKNTYGILRIDFLQLLYELVTVSDWDKFDLISKKIVDILVDHKEYRREHMIANYIQNLYKEKKSYKMILSAIIKTYPIVLQ